MLINKFKLHITQVHHNYFNNMDKILHQQHLIHHIVSFVPKVLVSTKCLEYMVENGNTKEVEYLVRFCSLPCNKKIIAKALQQENDTILWILQHATGIVEGADHIIGHGHLLFSKKLYNKYGDIFTSVGANLAAAQGHLHVIQWLFTTLNILCTSEGADWAAYTGRLDIVQWLSSNGVHCTIQSICNNLHQPVINWIRINVPNLEMDWIDRVKQSHFRLNLRRLKEHGIYVGSEETELQCMAVLQYNEICPGEKGQILANMAGKHRYVRMLNMLYERYNILCDVRGLKFAEENNQKHVIDWINAKY